jgi:hypothetical protein
VNEKSQRNKGQTTFQTEKEKNSTGNHERGDRTAEKHEETKTKRKVGNSSLLQPQIPNGKGKLKPQAQGKPFSPGNNRMAVLDTG